VLDVSSLIDQTHSAESESAISGAGDVIAEDISSLREEPRLQSLIRLEEAAAHSDVESSSTEVSLELIGRLNAGGAADEGISGGLDGRERASVQHIRLAEAADGVTPVGEGLGVTFEAVVAERAVEDWGLSLVEAEAEYRVLSGLGLAVDIILSEDIILVDAQEVAGGAKSHAPSTFS